MRVCPASDDGNHMYEIKGGFAVCINCMTAVTVASVTKRWMQVEPR